jgi:two-component system sensor histidine kinase/response regulator
MGNFVVELIAILLIYLLLPVTVRRRFYAAGLLTLFGFVVLFYGREQQPQEMARALAFAALLANFAGILVSYRHERLDRLQYYLLRSEQATRAELADANAELDAFSRTVAHDLKNPINAVHGGLHLLREELGSSADAPSSAEIFELMEEAVLRQQRIVNDLLLLANIRRGQDPPQNRIEMDALLRRVIAFLHTDVKNAGATVEVAGQLPAACGHESWIEQVWVNYLTNAIKYGGDPPRIECGGRIEDGVARFWVRDHGPGISAEEQDRLFIEFTRLNQVKVEGHGLGLSVARRIVEALGGNVGVESPADGGAEFWFTLPEQCVFTGVAADEPT